MAQDSIKCPNCGSLIPLSEALSHDIEERARLKYQAELEQSKKDFQEELVQKDKELLKRSDQ